MLSFFTRGVLDEILNLIESVSEGFPAYSCTVGHKFQRLSLLLKSQKTRSDRLGKTTSGLKIKVEKTPQELAESEPKAYPKHKEKDGPTYPNKQQNYRR